MSKRTDNHDTITGLIALINDHSTYRVDYNHASGGNYIITVGGHGNTVRTPKQAIEWLSAELVWFKTTGIGAGR